MLENLRFYPEEKQNDEIFAKKLASYADTYVNDAFAVSHRKHASVHKITEFLPSYKGLLLKKEIEYLDPNRYTKPVYVILGGSKLDTKMPVIDHMLEKADRLLLGGAMIFNFYKAKGYQIGKSLFDAESVELAKKLMDSSKIALPTDLVVSDNMEGEGKTSIVDVKEVPSDMIGLDIGPETIRMYKEELAQAGTIVWNGPLGYVEVDKFSHSTTQLAEFISNLSAKSIIGGGDTAAAVDKLGLKFTHVSTGGGASIEVLAGNALPALEHLKSDDLF